MKGRKERKEIGVTKQPENNDYSKFSPINN